jgi:hypothetical protein
MASFYTNDGTSNAQNLASNPKGQEGIVVQSNVVQDGSAPSQYICPVIAAMDASGSASFSTTTVQEKTVSIAGIDAVFTYTCADDEESAKVLNAFTCTGYSQGDASNNDLSVLMATDGTRADDFKALLMKAINEATSAASTENPLTVVNNPTAQAYLLDGLKDDLAVLIGRLFNPQVTTTSVVLSDGGFSSNTIKGLLNFSDEQLALDASGGAADMWASMDASGSEHPLTIYTQIPRLTSNLYIDASDNMTTSALPMQKGDSLVFVFDVTSSAVSFTDLGNTASIELGSDGAGDVSVNPAAPGAAGRYEENLSVAYTPNARRLAFEVKLSGSSGVVAGVKEREGPDATTH